MADSFLNLYLNRLNMPINRQNFGMVNQQINNPTTPSGDSFVRQKQETENNFLTLTGKMSEPSNRRNQNDTVSIDKRVGTERRQEQRISPFSNNIYNVKSTFKAFIDGLYQVKTEVNKRDNTAIHKKKLVYAIFASLSPIAPIRRISSVSDNIDDGNYARAAGLIGLMVINFPEDTRDLGAAWNQLAHGKLPCYDYKTCQTEFSFIRGTIIEPIVNKMGKLGVLLHRYDVTLYNTKFGKFLKKIFKFKINIFNSEITERYVPKITLDEANNLVVKKIEIRAFKVEGKPLAELIGRTILRIPVMSIAVLSLLELPNIIKKINNAKGAKNKLQEGRKQTAKSAVNVISIQAGIGLSGALLAKKGPAFSLIGMGVGSVLAFFASKQLQKKIDDLTDKK